MLKFAKSVGTDFAFLFFDDLEEVLAVLVPDHRLGEFTHAIFCDPSTTVCDGFKAGDLETLTFLYDLYES